MGDLVVIGAGAFGTALAVALSRDGTQVTLWGRDAALMQQMHETRRAPRLPDVTLPASIKLTSDYADLKGSGPILVSTPTQTLRDALRNIPDDLAGRAMIACCKGIDLKSHMGPSKVIAEVKPKCIPAILTGPSFAADIARGLPTALTLACADETLGKSLQQELSRPMFRLYLSSDVVGAELGGALKNVIAIACGACMGSGLGDSARSALMTRGFAEMMRLARYFGANAETLTGLSGFGDLALTCTSDLSRNYQYGMALGRGDAFDPTVTVEGVTTAQAVSDLARDIGVDMPIASAVCDISTGRASVPEALQSLLSRPLKKE